MLGLVELAVAVDENSRRDEIAHRIIGTRIFGFMVVVVIRDLISANVKRTQRVSSVHFKFWIML